MKFHQALEALKAKRFINDLKRFAENAQPFVCEPYKGPRETLKVGFEDDALDLPFKLCSFELYGDAMGFYFQSPMNSAQRVSILCIIAEEIAPKEIVFYAYGDFGERGLSFSCFEKGSDANGHMWWVLRQAIEDYLKVLRDGQHGTTSHRQAVKWKDEAGEKHSVKIKKVIHIRGQKTSQAESISDPRPNVSWSHAFWVMGHWRSHAGIGKDRDGNYTVSGKTWVVPHVRNAELGDPVNKIRLVKTKEVEEVEL